jgi:glutamine amidotransferase
MAKLIAVVDYGMANLLSVEHALLEVGFDARITSDPALVLVADAVVVPGVGAFTDAARNLKQFGLFEPLQQVLAENRPFLGICLGMQLLFERSAELDSQEEGLAFLKGSVVRFPPGLKVPHMGWNQLALAHPSPLLEGIPAGEYFYFVHSFYGAPEDEAVVLTRTPYSLDFCSAIQVGNVYATQFHPEKSQQAGRKLLANFRRLVELCS